MAVWRRFGEEALMFPVTVCYSQLVQLVQLAECQIDRHRILDTLPSGKVGDRGSSANGRAAGGQDQFDL